MLAAIFTFLAVNSLKSIQEVGLWTMISGPTGIPRPTPPSYGFLPAEVGSLWVAGVALSLSVPSRLLAAIYLSEFAGGRLKEITKSVVEFMAAVPSVVLGLLGLAYIAPTVQQGVPAPVGADRAHRRHRGRRHVPADHHLHLRGRAARVPVDLRQASLALGNTRWETTYKVTVPAASSGIFAAVMLGLGRAIGETMVVLMLAGTRA